MVGSAEVLRGVSHHVDCELPVLVPNEKGYEASQAAGAKLIAVFAAASESFSRANINCSIAESSTGSGGVPLQGRRRPGRATFHRARRVPMRARSSRRRWSIPHAVDLGCYEIARRHHRVARREGAQLLRAVAGNVPWPSRHAFHVPTPGIANLCRYGGGCRVVDSAAAASAAALRPGATAMSDRDVVYMLDAWAYDRRRYVKRLRRPMS